MSEKDIFETDKYLKVLKLYLQANDHLLKKFFDRESKKMLELKIEVLEKLKLGLTPSEIGDDYYTILENYPVDEIDEENDTIIIHKW